MNAQPSAAQQAWGDFAPKFAELADKVLFGDIWERKELSKRDRSLVTVAALVALNRTDQLRFHLQRALENGVKKAGIDRGNHTPGVLFRLAHGSERLDCRQRSLLEVMRTILMMTALVAALANFVAAANADEHSGTWKLNSAQSRYSSGSGLKSLTETVALDEKSYKVEANGTAADGTPVHIEFNARFDGKEYPMIGVPWADTVSVKWIDARTPQMIQKKSGEVTMTITCKVSKDRKTRTCTLKGKDEQGRKVNNVVVFDRQ